MRYLLVITLLVGAFCTFGCSNAISKEDRPSAPASEPVATKDTANQKTETTTVESLRGKWTPIYGEWNLNKSGVYSVMGDERRNKHKTYVNDVKVQSFTASVAIWKPKITSWAGFGFCFTDVDNTYFLSIQDGSIRLKKRVSGKEEQMAEGPKLSPTTATNWIFFNIDFRPGQIVVTFSSDGTTFAPLFDLKDESHSKGSLALMCCENEFTASYKVLSFVGTKAASPAAVAKVDSKDAPPQLAAKPQPSGTSVVIAEGVGATADEALKDAFRNSVRQVVGAVVDAETLVKNDEIISDKVLTYSDGFVKTYEEISKKQDKGLFRTKIKATIERRSVIAKLKAANITIKEVDGKGIFAEVVTQLDAEKNSKELLGKALEGFPLNVLQADVVGNPKVVERSDSGVVIRLEVTIQADQEKFSTLATKLESTLSKISRTAPREVTIVSERRKTDSLGDYEFQNKELVGPMKSADANSIAVALNYHHTQAFDRTSWKFYSIDKACRDPLDKAMFKGIKLKLTLIDQHGKTIATDTSALMWEYHRIPVSLIVPLSIWYPHEAAGKEKYYAISPLGFQNTSAYYVAYRQHKKTSRTIRLSLEEVRNIHQVKCEVTE